MKGGLGAEISGLNTENRDGLTIETLYYINIEYFSGTLKSGLRIEVVFRRGSTVLCFQC